MDMTRSNGCHLKQRLHQWLVSEEECIQNAQDNEHFAYSGTQTEKDQSAAAKLAVVHKALDRYKICICVTICYVLYAFKHRHPVILYCCWPNT